MIQLKMWLIESARQRTIIFRLHVSLLNGKQNRHHFHSHLVGICDFPVTSRQGGWENNTFVMLSNTVLGIVL